MSKNELCKRLSTIERKSSPEKTVVLKMWCPEGKTLQSGSNRLRIEPSNPEDAKL
jgi:hypothetical protein